MLLGINYWFVLDTNIMLHKFSIGSYIFLNKSNKFIKVLPERNGQV